MRWTIAYYLILLYTTVMVKPLIPITSDTLSHLFSETEHIATIHAKYGAHHLEKELSQTNTDNTNHQTTLSPEEFVLVHIAPNEISYELNLYSNIRQYLEMRPHIFNLIFIFKDTPPPKNCIV